MSKNPVYHLPSQASPYDDLAEQYDTIYGTPMALAENAVIFARIAPLIRKAEHILDVGCGTGLLLDTFPIGTLRYTGIDISAPVLTVAKRKHPYHSFVQGDMADLSRFADNSFDLVLCLFGSFNYTMRPEQTVAELARVLSPGGSLLCITNTPRHRARSSYAFAELDALHPLPQVVLSAQETLSLFSPSVTDISLLGFHCLPEMLCPHAPHWFLKLLLRLEMQMIGRVWPDACYFHVLLARKEESAW